MYMIWSASTNKKRSKISEATEENNNELKDLIKKKFKKVVKNKKRRKTEKELQHFHEIQISDY